MSSMDFMILLISPEDSEIFFIAITISSIYFLLSSNWELAYSVFSIAPALPCAFFLALLDISAKVADNS